MGSIPSPSNPGAGAVEQLASAIVTVETNYTGGANEQANLGAAMLQAEADVDALQALVGTDDSGGDLVTRVGALETADGEIWVQLKDLTWDTGAAIAPFVDNTTDGFTAASTESQGIRWNNSTAPRLVAAGEFHVPTSWDDTAGITMHFQGCRIGAADAAMVGTVTAFAQAVGTEFDADSDAGGNTTAFNGATKVITDETLAFAAGVLPAGAKVSFTFTPDAALDGDDFILTGIRIVGTVA